MREQPFRERPRGQLMLALYRCGRQAEALDAFQQARRTLVDELAVEPSSALRELEQAMLRQDASLEAPGPDPAVSKSASTSTDSRRSRPRLIDLPDEDLSTVRKTATVLVAKFATSAHADPEVARQAFASAERRAQEIVDRHGACRSFGGLGGSKRGSSACHWSRKTTHCGPSRGRGLAGRSRQPR